MYTGKYITKLGKELSATDEYWNGIAGKWMKVSTDKDGTIWLSESIAEKSFLVKVSNTEEAIERLEEVWGDDKDGKYAAHYKRITELFNHLVKVSNTIDKTQELNLLLAMEFGFKQHEKGNNFDMALINFKKLL